MNSALLTQLLDDLAQEGSELDLLVAELPAAAWATPTPAAGWTIAHQIAHLAGTDEVARLAVVDPDEFRTQRDRVDPTANGTIDAAAEAGAAAAPDELLHRWRTARAALASALLALPQGTRIPWFGPDMGATSMATARLMEVWAHGVDVRDALHLPTLATSRLRSVAHLGVRTRDFAFYQRSLNPPAAEFRVELTGPNGEPWTWGPPDAAQRVTGPALDFCLCVTRRRHRDDLALQVIGDDANRWIDVAQAYAGPPGPGRRPSRDSTEDSIPR
ncbi:TIGR03084 family metal-binding protein [Cryptosporangium minutisporangium]|uniref:TIGR03084 family metal-binding protein n=1 Tax=Cryptosporangium minutisporangium TaxID=113569 RepID=A0ABP6STV5_9ACTN